VTLLPSRGGEAIVDYVTAAPEPAAFGSGARAGV
jgi:hypothetical protein